MIFFLNVLNILIFLNKKKFLKAFKKRILWIIDQGALRAKKAGFDGIEIHGAQLTLVSLFSTKKFNRRTDEYGGSDENRARFIVEIVKKIREAVGKDFIISAKIDSPDEENGITESGFIYMAKALEEAGLDLMEVSGPNPIRQGEDPFFYEATKKIAEIVKTPVICIGGIKKYEKQILSWRIVILNILLCQENYWNNLILLKSGI